MLELLDAEWTLGDIAEAVGTYPREVRRVGWRYVERGVQAALTDEPRPKPPKLLDTRQQAAIVAMVCGPPPAGYAGWTVRVTTEESQRRGIVADVGRETIRQAEVLLAPRTVMVYDVDLEIEDGFGPLAGEGEIRRDDRGAAATTTSGSSNGWIIGHRSSRGRSCSRRPNLGRSPV